MDKLKFVALWAAYLMFVACSGVQDPNELKDDSPLGPYALSVDKTTIESDGTDFATLVITDSEGLVLTGEEYIRNTSFHVVETDEWRSGMGDDTPNLFSSITDGTYTISAMYKGVECENSVKVVSQNRVKYEKFHKNVAIYRLTGTWCQYCPSMTEALENIDDYTKDHSIVLEFHNDDEFSVAYSSIDLADFLLDRYGTKDDGYPYCIYSISDGSGKSTVNEIQRLVKKQLFEHPAGTGIKAESIWQDGLLSVKATVMASRTGKYDLGMAILKDNCKPNSASAYEEVYNDVVLGISGNFFGMSSESFELKDGEEKELTKEWEAGGMSGEDFHVVLFTLTEAAGKVIIDNAVTFRFGEGVDYKLN